MPNTRFAKGRIKLKKGEYIRPNGTFEYKWTDRYGSRHSVYAKTIPELRIKEDAILKDILDGINSISLNCTINSYFEIWKKIKCGIRDTTFAQYCLNYKCHIEPEFGLTKLKDITYSKIILFYKDLVEKHGLSKQSVGNVNIVLRMVLDVAVKDGVLRTNPCNGAVRGFNRECSGQVKEVKALTRDEQDYLEKYLNNPGPYHWLQPLITVMLYTGMRAGEVCGLRWDDIDFNKKEIHVNHTLVFFGKNDGQGKKFALHPPKTRTSDRFIPIGSKVIEALKRQRLLLQNYNSTDYSIDGLSGFVFLDKDGKVFYHISLNYYLKKITKEINKELKSNNENTTIKSFPDFHSHMLRHTFATRMREAGADIKATADIMGHTKVNITLDTYTDASQSFKRQEISLLERID